MKTLKKLLCVVLSLIMALSCFSVAAFATDETPEFVDGLKVYNSKADSYGTDKALDLVDKILADVNFKQVIDLGVTTLTIDLTSVNGLCDTIDLIESVWGIIDSDSIVGDLADLNFDVWKTGMSRGSQDETIIKELLEFVGTSQKKKVLEGLKYVEVDQTNGQIIAGLFDGDADLGLIENFFSINDLLGNEGLSGIIKQALLGDSYEAYKNNVDGFVFEALNGLAAQYLPGLTVSTDLTIEDLLVSAINIAFDKYIAPWLKELNVNLAANENEVIRSLAEIVVLNGAAYNFDSVELSSEASLLNQLNNEIGEVIVQIVPGYTWVTGDYKAISTNIEGLCRHLLSKASPEADVDSMDFDTVVKEAIAVILNNVDLGGLEDGITECDSFEDMLKVLLINVSTDLEIGVEYSEADTYLVVLGDIAAYYAYNFIDFRDTNSKIYQAGGGKDIFEVANYIANYYLFNKGVAGLLGLSVKKTDTIFTKIDKLCDYFGETKSKGVAFNSREFILGDSDTKGLLGSVFTLDIENILELTVVPALNTAGDVQLVKFVYNTVRYCLNNWAGDTTMIPAYQADAFTNALSNKSLGNAIAVLLTVLNSRSDEIITSLATVMSLVSSYKITSIIYAVIEFSKTGQADIFDKLEQEIGSVDGLIDVVKDFFKGKEADLEALKGYIDIIAETNPNVYTITEATVADFVYTGNVAKPVATVKVDGETLTQGIDFVVKTQNSEIGAATATIEGIGYYDGTFSVDYNIIFGSVGTVAATTTADSITLLWDAVAGAEQYNVYAVQDGAATLLATVAETQYTVSSLQPGTHYTYKVEAQSSIHGKTQSAQVTATTRPETVSSSSFKFTTTENSVVMTWSAAKGATGYRVDKYANGKWEKVAVVSKTTATITGLDYNKKYAFRVWSYTRDANKKVLYGSVSSHKWATTKLASVKLSASATSTTVKLSWDKVNGATGYQVYQYKSGAWTRIKVTTGTSYTVIGLKAATKQYFKVRAYKKVTKGYEYGDYTQKNIYTKLVKPSSLKVTKTTQTAVTLTWSKVSGATGYQVYHYKNGAWTRIKVTTGTSYTATGLKSGSNQYFYVRAYKKVGSSYIYGENSSTVKTKTLLATVSGITASRKSTSITLKWKACTGATGYQIYRYNGSNWVRVGTVTTNSFKNTGLTRNTTYKYRIRAYQKSGSTVTYGSFSSTFSAKTTLLG